MYHNIDTVRSNKLVLLYSRTLCAENGDDPADVYGVLLTSSIRYDKILEYKCGRCARDVLSIRYFRLQVKRGMHRFYIDASLRVRVCVFIVCYQSVG